MHSILSSMPNLEIRPSQPWLQRPFGSPPFAFTIRIENASSFFRSYDCAPSNRTPQKASKFICRSPAAGPKSFSRTSFQPYLKCVWLCILLHRANPKVAHTKFRDVAQCDKAEQCRNEWIFWFEGKWTGQELFYRLL